MKNKFQSEPLKQAQEIIFSRKRNKLHHPDIIFNCNPVKKALIKKYFGTFFDEHIKGAFDKSSKSIDFIPTSEMFHRDHLFYKSINLLLDLTLITATFSTKN